MGFALRGPFFAGRRTGPLPCCLRHVQSPFESRKGARGDLFGHHGAAAAIRSRAQERCQELRQRLGRLQKLHSRKDPMAKAKTSTFYDLFHHLLKDVYFAEKKILAALPKMAKAAKNEELAAAFKKHLMVDPE